MKKWLYPLWVIINALLFLAVISLWITAPEFRTLNIGLTVFSVALSILLFLLRSQEITQFIKINVILNIVFLIQYIIYLLLYYS